jgi:beta-lactamase regulating signal transducer with metallopeptidase domain
MSFSIFSAIMAVLWFDVFILLCSVLRRKTGVLLQYSLWPLIVLIIVIIARIFLPIEMPFATVIPSRRLMPALMNIWRTEIPLWEGAKVSIAWMVLSLCTAVSVILLIRLFLKIHQGNLFVRELYTEEDERANCILQDIIDQTKPGQYCTLHIAPDLVSPIVTGFFHPVILLPEDVKLLSDKQLRYILRHEWSHYLSKDLWVKLLIHMLCCVMWWNPPVYLLKKDLDQVLELNCDHRVTQKIQQRERLEYLETMIQVLKQYHGKENRTLEAGIGVSFVSVGKGSTTRQRFQLVYDNQNSIADWKTNLSFLFIMAILFLISFSFIFQPYCPAPDLGPNRVVIKVTPENAYIELSEDGTYLFYLNGEFCEALAPAMLEDEPFKSLPVINQNE